MDRDVAKKLKKEKELLKEALRIVMEDAVRRGIAEFEATDSHDLKIEYAYRLLVHDKEISPLPACGPDYDAQQETPISDVGFA